MKVLGIAGWSGSGKTTLVTKLLPLLVSRGIRVSTVKHAHHDFDIDQPGKDSWRHRQAGASEVLISSALRFALIHEHRGGTEPDLPELLGRMSPVDIVLVEGFKRERHPKIEVWRSSVGKPLLAANDPHIVAVATDNPRQGLPHKLDIPLLDLDDAPAVADFVVAHAMALADLS
jgi:molybdopterin-guanine dinucleotide biosynthesis adapter protein